MASIALLECSLQVQDLADLGIGSLSLTGVVGNIIIVIVVDFNSYGTVRVIDVIGILWYEVT